MSVVYLSRRRSARENQAIQRRFRANRHAAAEAGGREGDGRESYAEPVRYTFLHPFDFQPEA